MHVYQDYDTANAIGLKSYNALTGDLVALESRNMHTDHKNNPEEDCVDFAAATTAALGVPSPCLSKARSFDSPDSASDDLKLRKGDIEEEAELQRVLKLSEAEMPSFVGDPNVADFNGGPGSVSLDESTHPDKDEPVDSQDTSEKHVQSNNLELSGLSISDDCKASVNGNNDSLCSKSTQLIALSSPSSINSVNNLDQPTSVEPEVHTLCTEVEKSSSDTLVQNESAVSFSTGRDTAHVNKDHVDISIRGETIDNQSSATTDVHKAADEKNGYGTREFSILSEKGADLDPSSGQMQHVDACETLTSSVDGSEPIYEGEECIIDSRTTGFEDREPVYEGEVILAKQADESTLDARPKDEITPGEGEQSTQKIL